MTEKATFAAGCFWHVETAFCSVKGVVTTRVGYTGGHYNNPTYQDVCSGTTGHAEAVEVEFDPSEISYERLLDVFWDIHDPTQLNRQGLDIGAQYRSEIFYHSEEQKRTATASMEALQGSSEYRTRRIVTQVEPAHEFWQAEEYHQKYLAKHGRASCKI